MKLSEDQARSRSTPVQENMPVQQRLWRSERQGLWWMLAVVLLTLLGLFSKGPISTTQQTSAQGELRVAYERFLRNGASSSMTFELHGQPGSAVTLTIEGELLDGLSVEGITPPAERAGTYARSGMQLQLLADASGTARMHLEVRADGIGRYHSVVAAGPHRLELNQYIYP
jgi:hypothetical protein